MSIRTSIDRTHYQKNSSLQPSPTEPSRKKEIPAFKKRQFYEGDESLDRVATVFDCIKKNRFGSETDHFIKRCLERGIHMTEVQEILCKDCYLRMDWNARRKTWYYRFSGITSLGRKLAVVIHLNLNRNAVCFVTAIDCVRDSRRPTFEKLRESKIKSIRVKKEVSDPGRFSLDSFIKTKPLKRTPKSTEA